MDDAKKTAVIARLKEVGANKPCGRCGHNQFTVGDGVAGIPLYESETEMVERWLAVSKACPAISVTCTQCGYVVLHALKTLLRETS